MRNDPLSYDPNLLQSPASHIECPVTLHASLNAHGLYNPFQFVLRLSPEVHRKIGAIPKGIIKCGLDFESLQAYSTYLHETVHWWQHIGSTIGLMLSLSYPGQAHANHKHLKKLIASTGPKKSILRFVETSAAGGPDTPRGVANIVVNNHFDIEFFRILITNPSKIPDVVNDPMFDCVGHSYHIAYANIVSILASSFDPDFEIFPDPRGWDDAFDELRAAKQKGYYYRSAVDVMPLGASQIFEGQARFSQLQFLYFASNCQLSWDRVRSLGMLAGVYGKAFEEFLRLAELEWPDSIHHPFVALFLLVCDIAMNPSAGFPMPLRVFSTFIEDVDPGVRFIFLCRTIAEQRHDIAGMIKNYSRAEYAEVSEALCRPLMVDPPIAMTDAVLRWMRENDAVKGLLDEHRTFEYGQANLVVRLLFSHFLAFFADKFAKPELFCWPGAWMAGERVSPEIEEIFERQFAPFQDKPEDDGIYPRLMRGKVEDYVQSSFESFYAANVIYDLTRQWIAMPGPFEYDYSWLSAKGTPSEMKAFADRHFEEVYGVHPDRFEIV